VKCETPSLRTSRASSASGMVSESGRDSQSRHAERTSEAKLSRHARQYKISACKRRNILRIWRDRGDIVAVCTHPRRERERKKRGHIWYTCGVPKSATTQNVTALAFGLNSTYRSVALTVIASDGDGMSAGAVVLRSLAAPENSSTGPSSVVTLEFSRCTTPGCFIKYLKIAK